MKRSVSLTLLALLAIAHSAKVPAPFCDPDVPQDHTMCDDGIAGILTEETFNQIFKGRDSIIGDCHPRAQELFTYANLIEAQKSLNFFADFAAVGDCTTRKRELMAFLAQTSHETNGGWVGAPCGDKSYGYCFVEETCYETNDCDAYCDPNADCEGNYGVPCDCAPGKSYHGRGPIQISWNYNYAAFSNDVFGNDSVLQDPDLVLQDGVTAWASALWFWMKPQAPKPSCHDIMIDVWVPDTSIGYRGGLGAVTHAINGGLECGCDKELHYEKPVSRMEFYKRYIALVGLSESDECSSPDHSLLCRAMPELFSDTETECGGPPSDTCSESVSKTTTTTKAGEEVTDDVDDIEGTKEADITSTTTTTTSSFYICRPGNWTTPSPGATIRPFTTRPPVDGTATTEAPSVNSTATVSTRVGQTQPGTRPPGAECIHNKDCEVSPWCEMPYEEWCNQQDDYEDWCPWPHCVWDDGTPGTNIWDQIPICQEEVTSTSTSTISETDPVPASAMGRQVMGVVVGFLVFSSTSP